MTDHKQALVERELSFWKDQAGQLANLLDQANHTIGTLMTQVEVLTKQISWEEPPDGGDVT